VLSKRGLVEVGPPPAGAKGKTARLTDHGTAALDEYEQRVVRVEKAWTKQLGPRVVDDARAALSTLFARPTGLADTVTPHDGGWRTHKVYAERTAAFIADPAGALPRHPMVSHRGAYPDGA
jgi:hypothetical protein